MQVPEFETVQEAADVKAGHANRIADLTRHTQQGGFGQPDDAGVVVAERRKLQRADAELKRVTTLKEIRGARWNAAAQLERAVTDWLLHGGIPGGCMIEAVEDAPLSDLLKKGERIADAVERCRLQVARTCRRFASGEVALRGRQAWQRPQQNLSLMRLPKPRSRTCDRAIEHGLPISFATMMQTATVRGVETPAAGVCRDSRRLRALCWLFRDQLLAKINAALDEAADDEEAMSRAAAAGSRSDDHWRHAGGRAQRMQPDLVRRRHSRGDVIDFRSDTSPLAVLGLRLVTAPRQAAPGTTGGHAYDLVGSMRR